MTKCSETSLENRYEYSFFVNVATLAYFHISSRLNPQMCIVKFSFGKKVLILTFKVGTERPQNSKLILQCNNVSVTNTSIMKLCGPCIDLNIFVTGKYSLGNSHGEFGTVLTVKLVDMVCTQQTPNILLTF